MTSQSSDRLAEVRLILEQLKSTPFPKIGQLVGDFPLYDSLLAGAAVSALESHEVVPGEIPVPDIATMELVDDLRSRREISKEEQAFLQYFDLLAKLQLALDAS